MKKIKKTSLVLMMTVFFFGISFVWGNSTVLAVCTQKARDCGGTAYKNCAYDGDCGGCSGSGSNYCCYNYCEGGGWCRGDRWKCTDGTQPDCCAGCFSPETEVGVPEGEVKIKDLKPGETVISYLESEDGLVNSTIEEVHGVTKSAYYKLKLKDGRELTVTGEHPLYTIQEEQAPLTFFEHLKSESLTKKSIDYLLKLIK